MFNPIAIFILLMAMIIPWPAMSCEDQGGKRVIVGWTFEKLDEKRTVKLPIYGCAFK